ncbi:hypothetical protein pEaSNUABM6_00117 [Erwinia phage pEa_SNUABM_6]|nr:hypothetical protein pEaSNUABM6_00117 [Erwinia phage pEa_SNUABM_6]
MTAITAAFDGHDYAGKSTMVQKVRAVLEGLGLRVKVVNHPCADTETGQFARRQLVTGVGAAQVARAMCQDFEYTLQYVVPQYDVVLLDRWAPVTIANQGDEGRQEVFRSGVCNQPGSPEIYISMEVGFETAKLRRAKRLAEKGLDWDDAVSGKMFESEEAWDAYCDRYRYAFQILTEGGDKFQWLKFDEQSDPVTTPLTIASAIAVAYVNKLK